MAADGGSHVIDHDSHSDLLREFFDFGDDLILPDKPFEVKKEGNDFNSSDFASHFGNVDDVSDDFFMGATPSPSSSSTTSSSATGSNSASTCPPTRSNSSLEFAMSIANDFMNIDFESAADVDIGSLDDDLDIMGGYDPVAALGLNVDSKTTEQRDTKVEKEMKKKSKVVKAQQNILIHIDLNVPLKNVRSKLEKNYNVDLSDYTMWLQETTKLNDQSTLSEQCIEGTGIVKVQLNIQPFNDDGFKKINIVDVLKIDPDEICDEENLNKHSTDKRSNFDSAGEDMGSIGNFEDYDDEDDDFFEEDEIVDPVGGVEEDKPITNFVESVQFCELRKRFNYPLSVTEWTKLHTFHWAKWVNRTFNGVRLNESKWNIDGKTFCSMSQADFTLMVGYDPGNLLWSHFTLLRQTGMATVPSGMIETPAPHFNNFALQLQQQQLLLQQQRKLAQKAEYNFDYSAAARAAASVDCPPQPKKQRVILGKYEEGKVFINSDDSSNVHRTGNNGSNVQLWKFLLDILTDYRHRNVIRWSNGDGCLDGEFIMSQPEGVAQLWGQQKGKHTMNYEKLSRALRYYKGGNILDKVHNKKFTYRFVCDLRDIVGFSAIELDHRVREQVLRSEAAMADSLL